MASAMVLGEEASREVSTTALSEKEKKAIQLYELAEEKEIQGQLSDSVRYYREATKLCHNVEAIYRKHHLPVLIKKIQEERGKNATIRVNEELLKQIDVDKLLASFEFAQPIPIDPNNPEHAEEMDMVVKMGNLELKQRPPSPLLKLNDDVWLIILEMLYDKDPQSWFNFSMTCKRSAYLGFTNQYLWKFIWQRIYLTQIHGGMTYDDRIALYTEELPQYELSEKKMLRNVPFIRFGGVYISVVNYYSEGGRPEFSNSWTNPVKTVTYYRYLRFYPDGTCLLLLTHLDPSKVVPYIRRENKHAVPTGDVLERDLLLVEARRIFFGRWYKESLSRILVSIHDGPSKDYEYNYWLTLGNMAHYLHGKLSWERFITERKPSLPSLPWGQDDGLSVLPIVKEKPFRFLKVKSYISDM